MINLQSTETFVGCALDLDAELELPIRAIQNVDMYILLLNKDAPCVPNMSNFCFGCAQDIKGIPFMCYPWRSNANNRWNIIHNLKNDVIPDQSDEEIESEDI